MSSEEKLIEAFATALNISREEVVPDLKYQGIPNWDSISHMVLISELEAVLDVAIDTDDVIDLSSFQKAKDILTKYGVTF